jgi:phosphoglycolate phosphatase
VNAAAGRYRLILFDIDGTLVNSEALLLGSQRQTFADLGLVHPGREAGLAVIGLSLPQALMQLLNGQKPPGPLDGLVEHYSQVFRRLREDPAYHDPLYPGVAETLDALFAMPDLRLGIATGKSMRGVSYLLERHGWDKRFTTIQTADNARSKPDPDMVLQAMAATGASPDQTMMIGDSVHDTRMAKAAAVTMAAVSWGFQPADLLRCEGADLVLKTMPDVLMHLKQPA